MENLYRHLMSKYNKYVRPVRNNSDIVTVKLGLKLIQIADVVSIDVSILIPHRLNSFQDEKNQIFQTHVYVLHVGDSQLDWLEIEDLFFSKKWHDHSFVWSPNDFGDIEFIQIPNHLIWKPDLVLYNSKSYSVAFASPNSTRSGRKAQWTLFRLRREARLVENH